MGKVDIEFRTECSQSSICHIKQGVCGDIIHGLEPFALEDSPKCFGYVKMRTVWRKKEKEKKTRYKIGRKNLFLSPEGFVLPAIGTGSLSLSIPRVGPSFHFVPLLVFTDSFTL